MNETTYEQKKQVGVANTNERVLFEVLLPLWFQANEGKTRYSVENLGELKIINNLFPDAKAYGQPYSID